MGQDGMGRKKTHGRIEKANLFMHLAGKAVKPIQQAARGAT